MDFPVIWMYRLKLNQVSSFIKTWIRNLNFRSEANGECGAVGRPVRSADRGDLRDTALGPRRDIKLSGMYIYITISIIYVRADLI